MNSRKLQAGAVFPSTLVARLGGGTMDLARPGNGCDWRMVIVYRGSHCPVCTKYLTALNNQVDALNALGIDVVAVSADTQEKAAAQTDPIKPQFEIGYDLSTDQMKALGLYVSNPRSAAETDRPFAEPGLFVINSDGNTQIANLSNAPFGRPDLASMLMGLTFIRNPDNNYPIRGTWI